MDPISTRILLGTAGAGGEQVYVEDVFSTWLYTGNDGTQTITNGIDLAGEGGMVWVKTRNNGYTTSFTDHAIVDTARGDKILSSNTNNSDTYWGNPSGYFPSFNSNGFTVGAGSALANHSSRNYASWTFRKAPGFFDVVTYTGNGNSGRTVAHNLGSVPGVMIVKATSATGTWYVYHRDEGATKYLKLDETTSSSTGAGVWTNTAPTSSVFTTGTVTNYAGTEYVAYLFAHDAGGFGNNGTESVIKCGSYTGNASGVDLNLGWEPQWVLIKKVSGSGNVYTNWYIFDNMRGVVTGGTDTPLAANKPTEENGAYMYGTGNPANLIEFSSTGIRVDPGGSQFTAVNTASDDYIYVAIRRGPMRTPADATEVFASDNTREDYSTSGFGKSFYAGFPVDFALNPRGLDGTFPNRLAYTRFTGDSALRTNTTDAESSSSNSLYWDSNVGWYESGAASTNDIAYMFRRAPGFFDVVTYTGDGTFDGSYNVNHNLGVTPEFIIAKRRDSTNYWNCHHKDLTSDTYLISLNLSAAQINVGQSWGPATTTFKPQYAGNANYSSNHSAADYIAYLFATLPGVSKVGSYTGTGTTLQVDCGFTAGARFVLIKRTDSTGDWYVWDTARGIVSGNDPYLLLNSTAAEVTNTDYIDPYSAGFEISSTAPAAINASGGSFIFLSIA